MCWSVVVEANGTFAKISGLHMHVTLVGSLCGNVLVWLFASALLSWFAVLLWMVDEV
jgi:hypothetical protein